MSKENRTGNPADIRNPFGAPVFYQAETGSTMDDAREIVHRFTAEGIPVAEGTVAAAGFQHGGRGRIPARKWDSPPGENLICTTILHFPPPACITLRTGLAVAETFARFLPAGAGDVEIKWPNDVLCAGRKLAGILCESDGRFVYAGTGLNIGQREFPPEIRDKASSLALLAGGKPVPSVREVMEEFLACMQKVLRPDFPWKEALSARLYKKNRPAFFFPGQAEGLSPYTALPAVLPDTAVSGILRGVQEDGGLILETNGGLRVFYSGELRFPESDGGSGSTLQRSGT